LYGTRSDEGWGTTNRYRYRYRDRYRYRYRNRNRNRNRYRNRIEIAIVIATETNTDYPNSEYAGLISFVGRVRVPLRCVRVPLRCGGATWIAPALVTTGSSGNLLPVAECQEVFHLKAGLTADSGQESRF
jgi:hypothetical protein